MRFYNRMTEDFDDSTVAKVSPGSSAKDNWQTKLQTGMNANELREKAKRLHDILANIEAMSLEADDIFSLLSTGDSKHLELNIPILIQGLSKSKLEAVAKILLAIAEHAYVK